jgi:hypothetical protein
MAWVTQDLNLRLAGQPWTSAKAIADVENLDAVAAGDPGAPIVQAGWHPYDLTNAGGSETGLIYDHDVDGDIAEVLTPVFVLGYEYRLFMEGVAVTSASGVDMLVEARTAPDGAYLQVASGAASGTNGFLEFHRPFVVGERLFVTGVFGTGAGDAFGNSLQSAGNRFDRARIRPSSVVDITAGKVWLEKRYTGYPKT